ncbi:MAG: hypothetical protein DRQ88_04205 [Epsilonproteobacteria bacterium]|nr:MAG: hypothetical protein DRQ89_00520 [Campylobacterota bacterium]RLA67103.1 MAG: hypothetical protein DRQ88_04205 [Campylobacterota bacterium]
MFRYLSLILLFVSTLTYAAQTAYVKTARAVVYADEELSSPLGYVRRGKKLRVGEVKRKQGAVLPVIISGRVAYIEVKNLALPESKSKDEKGHISHIIEEEKDWKKVWLSNSRLVVDVALTDPGNEWNELVSSVGNAQNLMITVPILWEIRPLDSRWMFNLGMSVSNLSSQDISMLTLGGEFWAQFSLFDSYSFSLDLRGGYLLSTGGVKIRYSYTNETDNGSYWGYLIGAQARFFKGSQWELNVGLDWRRMVLSNLENINTRVGTYSLNHMGGISAFIGTNFDL